MNTIITWLAIGFCITQSAMFSGLNLAFFSIARLRLEIEAEDLNNQAAKKVLQIRKDSNFLLATILWGNVGINVLLTLLSNSVLFGVASFLFSTVVITFFGEIIPQAYFSRNALKMASFLSPIIRFYQILLFPVAKPSSLLLDFWLGKEGVEYVSQQILESYLERVTKEKDMDIDIDKVEGTGALNFLRLDDLMVSEEGENLLEQSIINLEFIDGRPVIPSYERGLHDPFIQKIIWHKKKWTILTDAQTKDCYILNSDDFVRELLVNNHGADINNHLFKPVKVSPEMNVSDAIVALKTGTADTGDHPIKNDVIIIWGESSKRIITGADILARLLRGI